MEINNSEKRKLFDVIKLNISQSFFQPIIYIDTYIFN